MYERLQKSLVKWHYERKKRRSDSVVLAGHHNANHVMPAGRGLDWFMSTPPERTAHVKLRVPLNTPMVVMRTWQDEAEVLAALKRLSPEPPFATPHCLVAFEGASLHRFEPGTALSQVSGPGEPLGEDMLRKLAEVFARTALVGRDQLPALPADWPADHKSSDAFLDHLVHHAEHEVYRRHRPEFGGLFDALGVPDDALARFRTRVSLRTRELQRRPYALLHTDLHRDNIVVLEDDGLFILDWELATYGDPLHDLATHLVRMQYTDDERELMKGIWEETLVRRGCSAMTAGMDTDLQAYLDFEYAQSVFADVVRAAVRLGTEPGSPDLGHSARMVRRALERAREPIGLDAVPTEDEIESALVDWHTLRYPERRRRWIFTVWAARNRAGAR
ncbi:phosphotransferase family protein [Streptomyces sp. NPDC088354]|uniref:phosphotransferase family protein n=1 Tax=unclassified Streptomyces TaxID=2593676 RepID=UPI0029BCE0D4|nr:aminoglycoside phosphotransferase family protein [Streptomyces sp. MI02-7b]MDX3076503.1 aminoglycoside phosphotransferase family protein [Streptomyces sp. MI02-7b]